MNLSYLWPHIWLEARVELWIMTRVFESLLLNRISSEPSGSRGFLRRLPWRKRYKSSALNLRFRFGVSSGHEIRRALGRLASWPYRFSSWPAVRRRTTDVVAISKSDILLPSFLAPIHHYILPFSSACSISPPLSFLLASFCCPFIVPFSFLLILNLSSDKFA